MVVALSNGTLVLLDACTGRLASLSHGNSTHTTAVSEKGCEVETCWYPSCSDQMALRVGVSRLWRRWGRERLLSESTHQLRPQAIGHSDQRIRERRQTSHPSGKQRDQVQENFQLIQTPGAPLRRFRMYSGAEVVLEAKMKSDSQSGSPVSICYLPLNNAYLIGSNQGSIRLMC